MREDLLRPEAGYRGVNIQVVVITDGNANDGEQLKNETEALYQFAAQVGCHWSISGCH